MFIVFTFSHFSVFSSGFPPLYSTLSADACYLPKMSSSKLVCFCTCVCVLCLFRDTSLQFGSHLFFPPHFSWQQHTNCGLVCIALYSQCVWRITCIGTWSQCLEMIDRRSELFVRFLQTRHSVLTHITRNIQFKLKKCVCVCMCTHTLH